MSKASPYLPLYVSDYLADTGHLSAAEHGAYLLLLMHSWRVGALPSDERQIARIARMSAREWAQSRDVLAAFFDEGWTQKRLENEREKARVKSEARSEAGSRGGLSKSLKNKEADVAIATGLPQQTPSKTLPSSSGSVSRGSSLRSEPSTSLRSVERASTPPRPAKADPKSRGTRLPADWMPSDADRQAALAEGMPAGEVDRTAARFRDFWSAKPGKDGVKLDWAATWRNWVRSDCERRGWAPVAAIATGPPIQPKPMLGPPVDRLPTSAELHAKWSKLTTPDFSHETDELH